MPSPASALGQKIGGTFDSAVLRLLRRYSEELNFDLLEPEEGKKIVRLPATHGVPKQVDNVIVAKGTRDPLIVVEIKWLKDSRHIYDKGGWIGGMEKIQYQNPTIRGAIAVLAGYWSPRILRQIQHSGQVAAIVMATTEEVYRIFARHGVDIRIDARRNTIANPAEALAQLDALPKDEIIAIGDEIVEQKAHQLYVLLNGVLTSVDQLAVENIEIILHTNQGNILREVFMSPSEAHKFVEQYTGKEAATRLKGKLREASTPYQASFLQND